MQAFDDGVRQVAGKILFGANVSASDADFLHDVRRRDDKRYEFKALRRLIGLSRQCRRREDREALAEFIRGQILGDDPESAMEISLVFDDETVATSGADPVQRALERHPNCRTTWERCRDALTRQLVATRRALDVVLTTPRAWT